MKPTMDKYVVKTNYGNVVASLSPLSLSLSLSQSPSLPCTLAMSKQTYYWTQLASDRQAVRLSFLLVLQTSDHIREQQ
jgi:hypothetical protein